MFTTEKLERLRRETRRENKRDAQFAIVGMKQSSCFTCQIGADSGSTPRPLHTDRQNRNVSHLNALSRYEHQLQCACMCMYVCERAQTSVCSSMQLSAGLTKNHI